MQPIIRVQNVSKTYTLTEKQPGFLGSLRQLVRPRRTTKTAVDGISFSINPGEFVGFIGPNGAGKTTTLKMLSGILYPTTGEISVMGFTPSRRQAEFLQRFSIVLGNKSQLWWDLPAYDTFLFHRAIYDIPQVDFDRRVQQLSEMLDITDVIHVPVRKLSLGQRMKAELVLALLHQPTVLLLDEPTIGVDVVSQQKIRSFLKAWNQEQGTTILLTSHYMDDIKELTNRVITIDHGQVIYDGSLDEMLRAYVHDKVFRLEFERDVRATDLALYGVLESLEERSAVLRVPREQVAATAAKILQQLPVADVLIEDVPIEDVVREIFSQGKS